MRQPLVYLAVGVSTALLYLAVAIGATRIFGAPPTEASLAGFAAAMPFSYLGHRLLTFRSAGQHRDELPRFVAVTAAGLAISAVVPQAMVVRWHWPPAAGYAGACIAVPAFNYVLMRLWVFVGRRRPGGDRPMPVPPQGHRPA
jgi:putative flippase GtrA